MPILIRPTKMWVLIDVSNGDDNSKRYLWWFPSRAKARKHKKWQNRQARKARLVGPFLYGLDAFEKRRPIPPLPK